MLLQELAESHCHCRLARTRPPHRPATRPTPDLSAGGHQRRGAGGDEQHQPHDASDYLTWPQVAINGEVLAAMSNINYAAPGGMLDTWMEGVQRAGVKNAMVIALDAQTKANAEAKGLTAHEMHIQVKCGFDFKAVNTRPCRRCALLLVVPLQPWSVTSWTAEDLEAADRMHSRVLILCWLCWHADTGSAGGQRRQPRRVRPQVPDVAPLPAAWLLCAAVRCGAHSIK
jgi:hypothetical protein